MEANENAQDFETFLPRASFTNDCEKCSMKHNEKDQGEAIAKAIRALFMKSDSQTIINSDQIFKATYITEA